MKRLLLFSLLFTPLLSIASAEAETVSAGDTAWVLIATAMVMLMTPAGLALFYGGLANNKSSLNTMGMSYLSFCVGTVVWVIIGYTLTFSEGNAIIGDLSYALLHNIKVTDVSGSIPTLLFIAFQGTFAAIAIAIVGGSIVERVRFSTWLIFSALWIVLVYTPIAHWVWGGGFLSNDGELDFAGGTVIHINAGVAGLVVAYLLGKRKESNGPQKPSSINLTVLGSALLWFGWFGFNAGSALEANGIAANALLVTNVAGSIGAISWILIEWFFEEKPTLIGTASGAVAGLVGITPAAGYVDVTAALIIGFLSGIIGYLGVIKLKKLLGYDDTLDAFGIHGLVGIFGAIATGLFANPEVNGAAGLFYGNPGQVGTQLFAVVVTIAYSAVATFITFKLTSFITRGARVDEVTETKGMDTAYHRETSFNLN